MVSFYVYNSELSIFEIAELKAYDYKVRLRGQRPVSGNVVIVAVDERSLAEQGKWPWPRTKQAKLVDKLSEAGVSAIGFDILFPEPDKSFSLESFKSELKKKGFSNLQENDLMQLIDEASSSDKKFADALANSERSVLGYYVDLSQENPSGIKVSELNPDLVNLIEFFEYSIIQFIDTQLAEDVENTGKAINFEQTGEEDLSYLFYIIKSIGISIYELSSAANSAGYTSFIQKPDGVVRKIPLVQKMGDHFYPPLSLALVKQATGLNLGIDFGKYGVDAIRVGDTIVPSNEKGDYVINWYGDGHTFEHIPATDVLTGKVGANELQNKIVIVGGTAAAIHDIHYSPFGGLYPGVESHANIIENILNQDFMKRPVEFHLIDIVMILGTGFLLSLASLYFKALVMAIMASVGIGGYLYFDHYMFNDQGIWVNVVFPVLTQLFVYTGITLYRFTFEEREKRFIKGAFSQYLAPAVVNQLVGDPNLLKLGGERKVLTAFFSDVAGFSTISEKLTPEELVLLLNEYLSEMTDIIMKYEGTVDKFEGDAIIAFFGAPIPQEDHARRACLATLDMQKRCNEMREVWREQGKHELFMRIGLNTGPMVVGNMGSKTRMDYTMMGDSVNLAARLEGVNKQYGTYDMFSEFTYEHVKDEVEVRELDLIRVVGKSEPVRIYQLLCRKGELDENMSKIIDLYAKGLEHYRKQEWDEALDSFGEVLEIDEKDGPSLTFFERCLLFQKESPPADWDGVFSMKTK